MKKIIFGAMAAAALLACSKEQVIEQNRANDEIGFSVVAENQTKAEDVYDSNHTMGAFTVSATYTNKDGITSWYFQNDLITKVQDGENYAWKNTAATRYWSADGTHDFYAIVNGTMTLDATPAKLPTVNFTPDTDVAKQKDLLYAVTKGLKKSDKKVVLNFRHALSQIEFKAKNTNSKLYVKISGVQVGNTPGVGTFAYPGKAGEAGVWNSCTTPTDYTVTLSPAVAVAGNNNAVGLTLSTDAIDDTRDFKKSMLLIPATTDAWVPERGEGTEGPGGGGDWGNGGKDDGVYPEPGADSGDPGNDGDNDGNEQGGSEHAMRRYNTASAGASDVTGSYLAVKCEIYNVAGGTYDEDTDVCLYNGWAIIPAAFSWEQGKKYIYTLVFGEGDFGYNGGNGENPIPAPDGEKVVTTMNYDVDVESFTKPDGETEKDREIIL